MLVKQTPHIVSFMRKADHTGSMIQQLEKWDIYEVTEDDVPDFPKLGMRPPGHPLCPKIFNFSLPGPIWKECI